MPAPYDVCGADSSTLALAAEQMNAHSDFVSSVRFSPDGTRVVSCSDSIFNPSLKLWSERSSLSPCLHLLVGRCGSGQWLKHVCVFTCVMQMRQRSRWWLRRVAKTAPLDLSVSRPTGQGLCQQATT